MEFVKQYIKVINYALIGMVFAFASFYLLTNAYHYLEIRKDFNTDFNTQPLVLDVQDKMKNVKSNISNFDANTYTGNLKVSQMSVIYQNLRECANSFNNDTIKNLKDKTTLSIIDVYNLRESYENDILGSCIVNNLYWTTTVDKDNFRSDYLVNNKDMMTHNVKSLLANTTYLKKDILNNSSYFFSTSIASSSIKNNTKDGFYEVMSAYSEAANFVEFVSKWFKSEVGGASTHD